VWAGVGVEPASQRVVVPQHDGKRQHERNRAEGIQRDLFNERVRGALAVFGLRMVSPACPFLMTNVYSSSAAL